MADHYCDYFYVPQDYKANMTSDVINETPERWMDFYPHPSYMSFLEAIFESIKGTSKTVWLAGNYGTGKSNAALVTQKLFMDDQSRVDKWFKDNNLDSKYSQLYEDLITNRNQKTVVIYDYNASGLGPNEEFIVRIEKTIIKNLTELGYKVPAEANIDKIIDRIREEGDRFFKTRDLIKEELEYLPLNVNTIEGVIELLRSEDNSENSYGKILLDVQKILHKKSIYLNADVPTFKEWYQKILNINGISRVIFIFDEFSDFLEANKTQLKTFEEVAECVSKQFYLIPVSHLNLNAYRSDKADSAQRSKDRFFERRLEMPPDTAFQLAAHAMKVYSEDGKAETWKKYKSILWDEIVPVVDEFEDTDISRESFKNVLPIHPMAGFLLKYLSENVSSNQRSIFEYLKGSANGHEFQDFIKEGGIRIPGKQFLTVDYLWKYFIDREDLGQNKEVIDVRMYYTKLRNSELRGIQEIDTRIRILKAVLLFVLLSTLNTGGHKRLQPTVENVKLSFKGDGTVQNVEAILEDLQQKHCFSIMNGNISLYASTDNSALQEEIARNKDDFNKLICDDTRSALWDFTRAYRSSNAASRFEIRVSDVAHTNGGSIAQSTKEKYGADSGSILLWFVVAKNKEDTVVVSEKIEALLKLWQNSYRVLFFSFDQTTFCDNNKDEWEEYVKLYSQYNLENDTSIKNQMLNNLKKSKEDWFKLLKECKSFSTHVWKDGKIETNVCDWGSFKKTITEFVQYSLPYNIDHLASNQNAFSTSGLATAARSGILDTEAKNQFKQMVDNLKKNGVSWEPNWFECNPDHPISHIHALFDKKIENTLGRGSNFNIRKAYIDLMKSPYGLCGDAFTALIIGFCLKDLLSKNYQDTDEKTPTPLDINGLAAMIESALKYGNEKPRSERTICKLTKEDRAFITYVPKMFGIVSTDTTVVASINLISEKIRQVSGRVPLWVLSPYVIKKENPFAEDICKILDNLCIILKTSSKGNTEERSNAVSNIGGLLNLKPGLVDAATPYFAQEVFKLAFSKYIVDSYPEMEQTACSVGDNSQKYLKSILDKASETASFLWEKSNLDANVADTIAEYELIYKVKDIVGTDVFVPYSEVINTLDMTINEKCKLSSEIILEEYPELQQVFNKLTIFLKPQNAETIKEFATCLESNSKTIKDIFFDSNYAEIINIIKKKVDVGLLSNEELKDILLSMNSGFRTPYPAYIKEFKSKLDESVKNSAVSQITKIWTKISECKNVDEWASTYHLPTKYVFEEDYRENLYGILRNPNSYSMDSLNWALGLMSNIEDIDIAIAQSSFLKDVIPKKYEVLHITFGGLASYLLNKYGPQPNNWQKIDVTDYVKQHYSTEFAPRVLKDLKHLDAEKLKDKIMELAKTNEDLGMLFLENIQ